MDCLGILPYFVLQELAGLHTCEVIRSAPEEPVLVEKPKLLRRFQSSTERLRDPQRHRCFGRVVRFLILAKWWRDVVQAASLALVDLRHCLPQFPRDCLSIIAMDAEKQFWTLADIAPVLIGPVDYVLVSDQRFFEHQIASLPAFSRWCFASSPST
jgi:hypothetical protein